MSIKIESNKAKLGFPRLGIFMGSPKVGKSTVMADLKNALICDLEGVGYDHIDVKNITRPTCKGDLISAMEYFFSKECEFKILVLDHIRCITSMFVDSLCKEKNVKFPEEVPYGKGPAEIRACLESTIKYIKLRISQQTDKYVFFVGHSTDRNGETRLDIDGKNETLFLGAIDFVGNIYRNAKEETCITFGSKQGHEFGCRNKYLAAYNGVLEWDNLFQVALGK